MTGLRSHYDVAIVGCGPVGATLANLLAGRGVETLVVDRESGIYALPRAIHFDGECMRVFQAAGIADALAPTLVVSPGMKFVDASGRLLIDWSRPTSVGPQGWHPSYRFHQPTLEGLLRDRLATRSCADLRVRHAVTAVEPSSDDVGLVIDDLDTDLVHRVQARYVVGCDGARSTIRRAMGSPLDDLGSHERWLVVDVILRGERPDLGDHSVQYCDPARPATYVRGVGRRRRWEFMLAPDEDALAMSRPEAIWSLLSPWIAPDEATLERPAVYTFHAVVARGWRRGRLLIAGDAAHQTPPFMGQGMCAGIRDASNLAWKLADVVRGATDDTLLDTYETERAPHARTFIETAVRLGGVIQTSDPIAAAERDARMIDRPEVFSTPQPRLGPGAHDDIGRAGTLAEQPTLADGSRLDDRVGYRAMLLATTEAASRLGDTVDDGACDGPHLVVADEVVLVDLLARLDARAVLVRPDRYIARIARDLDGLERLVRDDTTATA